MNLRQVISQVLTEEDFDLDPAGDIRMQDVKFLAAVEGFAEAKFLVEEASEETYTSGCMKFNNFKFCHNTGNICMMFSAPPFYFGMFHLDISWTGKIKS